MRQLVQIGPILIFVILTGCYLKETNDYCPGYDPSIEYTEHNVILTRVKLLTGDLVVNNDIAEDIILDIYHPDIWMNHSGSKYVIRNLQAHTIDTINFLIRDTIYGVGNDWGIRVSSKSNRSCVRILGASSIHIQNQFVVTVSNLFY